MRIRILSLYIVLFILFYACRSEQHKITFPYSQWTVGIGGYGIYNIYWYYDESLEYNTSFIKVPEGGDMAEWERWYQHLLAFRQKVRKNAEVIPPYIVYRYPDGNGNTLNFNSYAYDLQLKPGEYLIVKGKYKSPQTETKVYLNFTIKQKGKETTDATKKTVRSWDSLSVTRTSEWTDFTIKAKIPEFSTDSFSIAPFLQIQKPEAESKIFFNELTVTVPSSEQRKLLHEKISRFLDRQKKNNTFEVPHELEWTNSNYVMGFVYIWDTDFWDLKEGRYKVNEYCRLMEQEYGGMQSVILWHSYPNIGIDERNQFDFFRYMPGGLEGLKQVVADFHKNNVKVFLTYNPWDQDTRRPQLSDNEELANIIEAIDADGVFLDTWNSGVGNTSVFTVKTFLREALRQKGRELALTTELLPDFNHLVGPEALLSSWGQKTRTYNYTDLSWPKWIMPSHKQYYIQRMASDKKEILSYAWINGQGIQLWDNVFGRMNPWNAKDRQTLRKMNAIWKSFGNIYLTDNWKPFYPAENNAIISSIWEDKESKIINLVNITRDTLPFMMEAEPDGVYSYFDLWNGVPLIPEEVSGKSIVQTDILNFGCILVTAKASDDLKELLDHQQRETRKTLPDPDTFVIKLSTKVPLKFFYKYKPKSGFETDLLSVKGGTYNFHTEHHWREGGCYPNMDGKHNDDLLTTEREGTLKVLHNHSEKIDSYEIMPQVVTNRQFQKFLVATQYKPVFAENFLKHWNGKECPDSILDEPVVYVSLEDARAFAEWAGMRLPSEWEWQLAAESLGDKFVYNKVFEWNESERYDGNTRFVNLRGGCSRWFMTTSYWYLPTAKRGEVIGGPQRYDSHVKYFLMYPGMDRASTIGFRCIR